MIRSDGCRPGGHFVEIGEAGRQSGHRALAFVALVQDLERFLHRRAHRDETLAPARAGFGDAEHLLLGAFEDFLAAAPFRLEAVAGDLGAGIDQLAQHGFLAHDFGIGDDVRRARRRVRQLEHVARAADEFGQAVGVEPFAERHRVAGHVLVRQIADRAIDQAMILAVEIVFVELVGDAFPRALVEHQAAEHRLFGVDGMRRHAQRVDARGENTVRGCSHGFVFA